MEQDFVDIMLLVAYGLIGFATVAAIILPLISAIGNPKSLVKSLAGVVAILVIYGIAYSISGSEVTPIYAKFGIGEGLSKFVGGALITVYILVIISVVGIVLTEISKIFS